MLTVLFIVLILLLVGALPTWNYSRAWGWSPVGIIGFVLILVLVVYLVRGGL